MNELKQEMQLRWNTHADSYDDANAHGIHSPEEIQRWTRLGYLRFYYRPTMIRRQLKNVTSLSLLKRSLGTAWQMVKQADLGEESTGMEVLG